MVYDEEKLNAAHDQQLEMQKRREAGINDYKNPVQVRLDSIDSSLSARVNWGAYNSNASYRAQIDHWINMLESYKGSEYFDQIAGINVTANYVPTTADAWAEAFNIKNGNRGRFYEEFASGLGTSLSEMASIIREEKHNSPAAVAGRERAAGVNTDLNGLPAGAGAASEASEFPQENAPVFEDTFNDFISQQFNLGMSFLSTVFGAVSHIKEYQAMDLQRKTGRVLLDTAEFSQGREEMELARNAGDVVLRDIENSISLAEADDEGNLDLNILKAAFKNGPSFKNRHAEHYYKKYISQFLKDVKGDSPEGTLKNKILRQKLLDQLESLKVSRAERHSHEWYSDDIDEMSNKVASLFSDLEDKLYNLQLNASVDYENSFTDDEGNRISSGKARGISDSKSLNVEALIKKFQEDTESVWSELAEWLKDKAKQKEKSVIYNLGLMALPLLKNLSMQSLVTMLANFKGAPEKPDGKTVITRQGDKYNWREERQTM